MKKYTRPCMFDYRLKSKMFAIFSLLFTITQKIVEKFNKKMQHSTMDFTCRLTNANVFDEKTRWCTCSSPLVSHVHEQAFYPKTKVSS